MLIMNVAGLRYSMAAGYLPASPLYASHFNTTSYNTRSGGCGNCTRSQSDANTEYQCSYGKCLLGWPEMGREDEALRELVANWHCLTPSVKTIIMDLARRD
jgi:hypothetical protein